MLKRLFFHTLIALLGLWAATKFVSGVSFIGSATVFILCGFTLGFLNSFIKPVLTKASFLLRLLTLGLFSFIIDLTILCFVDIIFPELKIEGIIPLLFTGLILYLAQKFLYLK